MQRTIRRLGAATLALVGTGATMPTPAAVRSTHDLPPTEQADTDAPAPAVRVFDAQTGKPIPRVETARKGATLVVRAPGYQEVRIATGAAPVNTQVARGPRGVALCKVGATDRDGDGLCDDAERQYRTDPDSADTDGDAIIDRIEVDGDALADGTSFSLEAYGASPFHKDIFVYINWTKGADPHQAAVDMVTAAFASAPGLNTDLTPGINVHFLPGGEIPDQRDLPLTEEELVGIRNQFFPQTYSFPFHYVIFSDYLQGRDASGYSPNIPGLNFEVTLKLIRDEPTEGLTLLGEAGTIMHELGHNLGLRHGGDDDENFKPNYFSVMNYLYQFYGFQRDPLGVAPRVLDFSRFTTDGYDEHELDEPTGFGRLFPESNDDIVTLYTPSYCRELSPDQNDCLDWGELRGSVPGGLDFDDDGAFTRERMKGDVNGDASIDVHPGGINDWVVLDYTGVPKPDLVRVVAQNQPCALPHPHTVHRGPIPLLEE